MIVFQLEVNHKCNFLCYMYKNSITCDSPDYKYAATHATAAGCGLLSSRTLHLYSYVTLLPTSSVPS